MKVEYRRKTDKIPEELHTFKPEQRRKAFWVGLATYVIGFIIILAQGLSGVSGGG